MNKDKIRHVLWERAFVKDLQRELVDRSVGAYKEEYIGSPHTETDKFKKAEIQVRNNVFHGIVTMLTSNMMNVVFEKTIEEIVDIIKTEGN